MSTPVQLCSNALLSIGSKPINSFEDLTDAAQAARSLYPTVRDAILRAHPWNCAIKRVVLSPDAIAPAFDYAYQYTVPGDWLRTMSVGRVGDEPEYKAEGRKILTDASALYLRYIFRNTVTGSWDALLIQCVEVAMAAALAPAIPRDLNKAKAKQFELEQLLKQARAVDGMDETPETVGDSPLLAIRYS
ncbi:hypothetical protein [Arenimonas sp.]|uniref:hypothetical protein n=1 Tax=Arenimonas sp. TaxID=1872635 RepID=UPI0039E4B769